MGNGAGARTQVVTGRHRPSAAPEEPEYDAYDFEADEEEERKARRKRALTIAGVVLVCIAVLALAAWLTTMLLGNNNSGNSTNAEVPKVVGMAAPAAQQLLHDKGFTNAPLQYAICAPTTDGSTPPCTQDQIGNVIKQDPPSGNVPKTTAITLTVGKSPDSFPMPDVSGKTIQEATDILKAAKLVVSPTQNQETVDNTALIGKVSSTTPPVSSQVTQGTTVTLNIGKGPDQTLLPDVTGQNYNAAKTNLENAGFKVVQATQSSTKPKDQVLSQSPQGNTKVAPGSTITLTVSLGDQFSMPNLTGQTVAAAQSLLQSQFGWTGSFSQQQGDFDQNKQGTIESFTPDVGQPVKKGQTIQIQVFTGLGGTTTPTTTR